MGEDFLISALKNINDTILIYNYKEELVYSNHDDFKGKKILSKKIFTYHGNNYCLVVLSSSLNKDLVYDIDDLTGLLTKGAFKKWIKQIDLKEENNVVVFCDMDNLKSFNENYGHIETDKVIKDVSDILRNNTRATDIIARFGGDEFVMLLQGISLEKCYEKIEDIRKKINAKTFDLRTVKDGKIESVHASMTFGMALVSNGISDSLVCADDLLLKGKNKEKNKVYVLKRKKD